MHNYVTCNDGPGICRLRSKVFLLLFLSRRNQTSCKCTTYHKMDLNEPLICYFVNIWKQWSQWTVYCCPWTSKVSSFFPRKRNCSFSSVVYLHRGCEVTCREIRILAEKRNFRLSTANLARRTVTISSYAAYVFKRMHSFESSTQNDKHRQWTSLLRVAFRTVFVYYNSQTAYIKYTL